MKRQLQKFFRDKGGNFAMIFGLAVVPLFAAFGIGIDYYMRQSYKARYDAAADAASVAAANTAQAYIQSNYGQFSAATLLGNAKAAASAQGLKVFAANAGTGQAQVPVSVTVAVTQTGAKINATVTYTGLMQLHFGPLVGVNTLTVAGTSTAILGMGLANYANYYVVVDVSQSMGIGDTQADMARLYSLTSGTFGGSCVFGCHSVLASTDRYTNEEIAHNANPPITLRIDSAKVAVKNMIAQAQMTPGNSGNIKIGLYTMQLNPNTNALLTTISAPSSNYSTLTTQANAIDLGPNNMNNPSDSDIVNSLNALGALVPANGDGLTAATPKNFVFIVTDGVQDTPGQRSRNTSALNPAACTPLKSHATVGVVYTTYLPIYRQNNPGSGFESHYASEVAPFAAQIAPNLQNCATSPNFFIQADDGPALQAAVAALFTASSQPVALSQ